MTYTIREKNGGLISPSIACSNRTSFFIGFRTKAMCVNGVCAANAVTGVTNACVYLCGQASCLNAVDPGVCDMTKLLPGYTGVKYTCINGNYYSTQFVFVL